MSILQELKQRKVFRVAAVYAIVAWGLLQVIDVINTPLNLPAWFSTVILLFLAIGFPIALIFSWIFDIGPQGLSKTPSGPVSPISARSGIEVALLFLLIVGIGWLIFREVSTSSAEPTSRAGVPIVVLMDTFAPRGVYDEETRRKSGTNADVLSHVLESLPVITQKETIGSTWDREIQVLNQNPSLILIHRSAFFHSMNQDLGIGYPANKEPSSEHFQRLYQMADNKLVAFMGFIAQGNRGTRFIVYSRGTGGGWTEDEYRANWIRQAQGRFPELTDRITALPVPGGTAAGSFTRPDAVEIIHTLVQDILQLESEKLD
jgi:hypothetical protein